MTRTASCQCRGFRVIVDAEPDFVSICHCQFCQRRTGVPLACNAYFPKSKVRLEGEHKIYSREAADGRKMHIGPSRLPSNRFGKKKCGHSAFPAWSTGS